jgi:hypothetical protein
MHKLKITTGIHQFTAADLEHLSLANLETGKFNAEVFADLTTAGKAIVVSGCDFYVTPSSALAFRAGWIALGGELYYFAGKGVNTADILFGSYKPYFLVSETYRADNPISYGNGSSQNVHAFREMIMGFQAPAPGNDPSTLTFPANSYSFDNPAGSNMVYGQQVLYNKLKAQVGGTSWQTVGVTVGAATWLNGFNHGNGDLVKYHKNIAECVYLQGVLNLGAVSTLFPSNITTSAGANVFRLPIGMRPTTQQETSVRIQTWSGWCTAVFTVETSGYVMLKFSQKDAAVTSADFGPTIDAKLQLSFTAMI